DADVPLPTLAGILPESSCQISPESPPGRRFLTILYCFRIEYNMACSLATMPRDNRLADPEGSTSSACRSTVLRCCDKIQICRLRWGSHSRRERRMRSASFVFGGTGCR